MRLKSLVNESTYVKVDISKELYAELHRHCLAELAEDPPENMGCQREFH